MCELESRVRQKQYKVTSLHKVEIMENFVRAMNKEVAGCQYLKIVRRNFCVTIFFGI